MVEGDTATTGQGLGQRMRTATGQGLGHMQERQGPSTQFARLSVEMPDYGSLTNINIETQPQPLHPRQQKHRTSAQPQSQPQPQPQPTSSAVTSLPSVYL